MANTILIVDDSRMMRGMVRGALEEDKHQVVEARDGQEALAVMEKTNPDLVITDINMPTMDGLTLIRAVRERPQWRMTPILVLTTESADGLKRTGREAGATGWIVKPFEPVQLRETAIYALRLREKAIRQEEEPAP